MQPTIYEVKNGADAGKHCQLNLDGTFRFPTATNNQLINTVDPNGLPIRVIGPGAHQRAKSVDVDLLNKDGSGLLGSAFGLSGEKCEILLK